MDIQLLSIADCPNTEIAAAALTGALAELGRADITVTQTTLTSSEDTVGTAFAGSPTIVVDGVDLFAGTPSRELACRVYSTPEGLRGAPTQEQIAAALGALLQR